MYSLSIPRALWPEVQKYLAHNYWCHRDHYTYAHHDHTVELVCLKPDLYELVQHRFNLG